MVSQIRISYRTSALSQGAAGRHKGGDRLPWVASGPDNFAPLRSMNWQAHCYGTLPGDLENYFNGQHIPSHVFPWSRLASQAGLRKDAVYLIRPDGYIGLIERRANVNNVDAYVKNGASENRNKCQHYFLKIKYTAPISSTKPIRWLILKEMF